MDDSDDAISHKTSALTSATSPAASPSDRKFRRSSIPIVDANGDRRQAIPITGNFIRAEAQHEDQVESSLLKRSCEFLERVLESPYFANFMAFVILLDAYCACQDIDARAAKADAPVLFLLISDLCLALYTFEVAGTLFLRRWAGLRDPMVQLDILIVTAGYVELFMQALASRSLNVNMQVMRVLRLARIIRLMRLLKKVRAFRELFKLVTMMSTCFLTLLWSFLFCFLVMTGWAMLMVEYVHPLIEKMVADGIFISCDEQCRRATSSVMDANLLLFKTVVAGDSWGEIAVPVIQSYPETAIIFVGSSLTLVFGVLNLIVAVIVDTFAEARSNEFDDLAEEMNDDVEYDRKELQKLFDRIDRNGSGQLTLDDLVEGARTDSAFQSRLRVMDIDEHDLQQLFAMIDSDGSGYIEASEFVGPLSRWVHDSKTAPRFIKYNMMQSLQLQEEIYDLAFDHFERFSGQLEKLSLTMRKMAKGAGAAVDTDEESGLGSDSSSSSSSDSDDDKEEEGNSKVQPTQPTAVETDVEVSAKGSTSSELEAELRAVAEKLEISLSNSTVEIDSGLRSAVERLESLLGPGPSHAKTPPESPVRVRRPSVNSETLASTFGGSRGRVRAAGSLFKQMYISETDGVEVRGVLSESGRARHSGRKNTAPSDFLPPALRKLQRDHSSPTSALEKPRSLFKSSSTMSASLEPTSWAQPTPPPLPCTPDPPA